MLKYTIGADPELFIFNKKTKKVVSAIDKIPGYKDFPYTENLPEGFGLQTDNILAEFNIPPVDNEDAFVENIEFMKNIIREMIYKLDENYDILCQASSKVPKKELTHPQAKEAGCMPDYCIYTGEKNPPIKLGRTTLRSSGCHLHVGYPNPNIDASLLMLMYVDTYVGIPSILYDTDTDRRTLYGKAGCFRLCDYGFEYRTLSSYWIDSEDKLRFIYRQLIYALDNFERNSELPNPVVVRNIINTSDVEAAKAIIERYNLICPKNN